MCGIPYPVFGMNMEGIWVEKKRMLYVCLVLVFGMKGFWKWKVVDRS